MTAEDFFINILKDTVISPRPSVMVFIHNGSNIMIDNKENSKFLVCFDTIWYELMSRYHMNNDEIEEFIKHLMLKHLNYTIVKGVKTFYYKTQVYFLI